MKLILTVLAFFGLIHAHYGQFQDLPKCSWNDPNLTACLVELFDVVRPMLKTGIPGIFPGLEPLNIASVPVETSLPGMKIKIEAYDIVANGASDAEITNFRIDPGKKTADITVAIPKLDVISGYTFDSHHVIFPDLHSVGTFSGEFYDIIIKVHVHGQFDNDDKPERIIVQDVTVDISFGKQSTYKLRTLEGDMTAKIATKLANMASKRLVLFMLKSSMNKAAGRMIRKYLNIILEKIPLNYVIN